MTQKPYDDVDVKLVERAIHDVTPPVRDGYVDGSDLLTAEARAVLDILAAAGRLKPSTTDEQVRAGADALVRLRTAAPSLSELDAEEQSFWLRDAAAVLEAAGPLTTNGRCGHRAPTLALLAGAVQPTCCLTSGHAGWHRGDDGSEWIEHGIPVDADVVQRMLDDATRAFADAGTSSERVEILRDLLAGWYAAWPATAVTDEHEPIAWQVVSLINAAEARASTEPGQSCPCTCHQPGRCPCQPGTPAHHHGAGGYCTVGEPGQDHHVIAFAGDGTWTLTHPAGCTVAAGAPRPDAVHDCAVRQLAERQVPSDLATLMAGGRYTCSAGDLGDLFQLGERLHDDQCTQPECAACGCWCHAEEQTEG